MTGLTYVSRYLATWALTLSGSLLLAGPDCSRVPFTLRQHLIVVRVSIPPLTDLNFALDTGTSTSVVSPALARRLGLQGTVKKVAAWGKSLSVRQSTISSLQIGELEFPDVLVQILDSPGNALDGLDGLIGLNLLRRTIFTIDFSRQEVTFGNSEAPEHLASFYPGSPFVLLSLTIQGKRLQFKVDTGAPSVVLFAGQLPQGVAVGRLGPTHARHQAGGLGNWREINLTDVALGDRNWSDLKALLLEGRQVPEPGLVGSLGLDSLGLKRFQVDFGAGKVGWDD